MNLSFTDKVALITGATSGIGEATAKALAELKCNLMLTGRNEQKLGNLQKHFSSAGITCEVLAGDISDSGFREKLINETLQRFGRLDVLINSAGVIEMGTIETTTLAEYDRTMDINLRSVFHLIQLAIPHLAKTKGNIVNVSSVAGLRSFPGIAAYCISKAGLDQLTRCAALEVAPKGIRVNAVNPGVVITALHTSSGMSEEQYQAFLERGKQSHPLGRVGKPEEVADLIVYLASDSAGWITGGTYSIDGGRAQTCAR